jgi:hypothetical protein
VNRPAALLACTTLALAGTTAYLYLRLQETTALAEQVTTVFTGNAEFADHRASSAAWAVDPITASPPQTSTTVTSSSKTEIAAEQEAGRLAVVRYRLEQLRSPAGRAEQLARFTTLERGNWQQIADHLRMTPAEYTQFIDAMAERTTQGVQRRLECQIDANCDLAALDTARRLERERGVAESLGPERNARYKAFQATWEERSQAFNLNAQFAADSKLTESQNERLVAAWHEARSRFEDNASQHGQKIEGYTGTVHVNSAAVAGSADESQRRLESATQYAADQYLAAEAILGREQLGRFKSIQDAALDAYKDELERQEIYNSTRKAASSGK